MTKKVNFGTRYPYALGRMMRRATDRIHNFSLGRTRALEGFPKRYNRSGEEGATIVEMALSMIILLSVMFGLIEICMALYTYHYVSDAAREGTRYAIVHGSTCTVSGTSCTVTEPQIQTYVQGLGYPGINPSNLTVTTTWSAYPGGGTCVAPGCNGPGDLVTVLATYNFNLSIPFVQSALLKLTSTSSMVISQ